MAQIQSVIDVRLIPMLVRMVMREKDPDVLGELLWTLGNGCSGGSDAQITYFVDVGIIMALCCGLEEKNVDSIKVSLEALDKILCTGEKKRKGEEENPYLRLVDESFGLDFIATLVRHNDPDVSTMSEKLLKKLPDPSW